jgi:hypothetical protein
MALTVEALNVLMLLIPGLLAGQTYYSFFQVVVQRFLRTFSEAAVPV